MLIMPSTSKNFQAMAESIANNFFNNGTPLSDGIAKVAKEHKMVPEEVKRLTEKSNTAASIMHLKNAEDKKASFKLASIDEVLAITHPTEDVDTAVEAQEKTASLFPNTRKSILMEKAASCIERDCTTGKWLTPGKVYSGKKKDNPVPAARRAKEKLQLEKKSCELFLDSVIKDLCTRYRGRDTSSFSKMAADASVLYGKDVETFLQVIADNVGASMSCNKTASIIDDTTKDMLTMKKVADTLPRMYEIEKNINMLEEGINDILSNIDGQVL